MSAPVEPNLVEITNRVGLDPVVVDTVIPVGVVTDTWLADSGFGTIRGSIPLEEMSLSASDSVATLNFRYSINTDATGFFGTRDVTFFDGVATGTVSSDASSISSGTITGTFQ